MGRKTTEELNSLLDDEEALDEINKTYKRETFNDLALEIIKKYGHTKSYVISKIPLNDRYITRMFTGQESPSRDFCIGVSLSLGIGEKGIEAADRLLTKAGFGILYPQNERDMYIMHCIVKKKSIEETNELLERKNLKKMFVKSKK